MPKKCNKQTRAQIADFLPAALHKAIHSYEIYAASIDHKDNESFSEYHKNAKVALAHIELLIKLAAWANVQDENTQRAQAALRSEALAETNEFHKMPASGISDE